MTGTILNYTPESEVESEQALRKFSETAKGWYWNMEKLEIMLSELKMSESDRHFDCY